MGIRVEAMHHSAQVEQPARDRRLFRRLATVFLSGLVSGVGLSFVGLLNHTISPAAFQWTISAGLGLISGFTARRALREHTALLRLLASIATVMVSLIFIGWMSGGDAGLVLQRGARPMADWGGLFQVTIGAASAFLAMNAWNRRRPGSPADLAVRVPEAEGAPPLAERPSVSVIERASSALQGANRNLQSWLALRAEQVREGTARRARGWMSTWHAIRLTPRLPEWKPFPRLLRRRNSLPHGRVRLLGVEEHRCPYCLDLVEQHDPRGVVTCKVCHTRHHADCWAVTGMCQVPHYHR